MISQVGVRKAAYGAYAPLLTADKLALVVIIITITIITITITITTITIITIIISTIIRGACGALWACRPRGAHRPL